MKILYKNKTAEKGFSAQYQKKWRYPEVVKTKLMAARTYIEQANSFGDVYAFIPFHMHRLSADRKDEWTLYLGNTGYRVTIIPCDEKGNKIVRGDILEQCKAIRIIMITEVSNHYE